MNPLKHTMLRIVFGAAIVIGASGSARADAFAQSILVIDNFRLLHANGTPFTASDFALLAGATDAHVTAQLNGRSSSDAQSVDFTSGLGLDVGRQSLGDGALARLENNFDPYRGAPASSGHADQRMIGSMITTGCTAAGALIQSRADASLDVPGSASGNSDTGTATTFSFALGVGEHMTIAFDALPFTQAYVSEASGASANARLSWSISLRDLSTGATAFWLQPAQLNSLSNVSRTNGMDGDTTYAPGWLSFWAATDMLNAGDTYQITISQSTLGSALQSQAMPEPGSLAVFGAGLLALAAWGRRRRPVRASGHS